MRNKKKFLPFADGLLFHSSTDMTYTYQLSKDKTKIDTVREIEKLKAFHELFFDCEEIQMMDDTIEFLYLVSEKYMPVSTLKKEHALKKLAILESILDVETITPYTTVIHPDNIFYHQDTARVKFLYRGIPVLLPSSGFEGISLIHQFKCLIFALFTTRKYNDLKQNGFSVLTEKERTEFLEKVINVNSIEDLRMLLQHEQNAYKADFLEKQEQQPSKKSFQTLSQPKKLLIGAGIAVICLSLFFMISPDRSSTAKGEDIQLQQDITEMKKELQAYQYIQLNDTDQAIKTLESLKHPSELTKKTLARQYLKTKQPDNVVKAIQLDNAVAAQAAQLLAKQNAIDALLKIKTKDPYILIEQANLKKEWDKVLELSLSSSELRDSDRAKELRATAYIEKGEWSAGEAIAKELNNKSLLVAAKKKEIEVALVAQYPDDNAKSDAINRLNHELLTLQK